MNILICVKKGKDNMIKAMITPEDWQELVRLLSKFQIGYTVSYDQHRNEYLEKLVVINPIAVQYYFDENGDVK